jgi:radical SAM family uncharacterized protein/radical SAM-linked protein
MTDLTIQDILPLVEKPSRYMGNEINRIVKDPGEVAVSIALAFPDLYEIGTSHFGIQILYDILNNIDAVVAERVFTPADDMALELQQADLKLASLESRRPLAEFDIVGFSLLYELTYTNILRMLDLAGIPFFSNQRDHRHPLIIAGGPCTCNPEPVADFFDAIVVGEGEIVFPEMTATFIRWQEDGGSDRADLLTHWSAIEGVYIPSYYQADYDSEGFQRLIPKVGAPPQIRRALVPDLESAPFPESPIIPFGRPVHDRLRLEIARGCTRGCRFCQAGMIYRPVRERSPGKLMELARTSYQNTGYEDVSLLSLSTGDYSCLIPLMKDLMGEWREQRVAVSLPSLRAGTLTPEVMELIREVRKTGFTIAPEAGTQRLRNVINKNVDRQEIVDTVRQAFELGWQVIKLYFMIGLPTETRADLEGVVDLVMELRTIARSYKKKNRINVSFSTFIPKPHVPFQWAPQIDLDTSREKLAWLKRKLKVPGVYVKWQQPEISLLEGVFARGDRRLSRLVVEAYENGCRFDGWADRFNYRLWQTTLEALDLDVDFYTTRDRTINEPLPWDHIDIRVDKQFLQKEWAAALEGSTIDDCRWGQCENCGACDFDTVKPVVYNPESVEPGRTRNPIVNSGSSPAWVYEITYSKKDDARLLGHLEFANCFLRAISRAGLPVKYSEGFHPKPRVSFNNPLPVGVESLEEFARISFTRTEKPDHIQRAMNRQLPAGVRVEACRLAPKKTGVPRSLVSRYRIAIPQMSLDPERVARFNEQSAVEYVRTSNKGKLQKMDLKAIVSIDELPDPNSIVLTIRTGDGPTVRPGEAISQIFDLPENTVRQARIVKQPR